MQGFFWVWGFMAKDLGFVWVYGFMAEDAGFLLGLGAYG